MDRRDQRRRNEPAVAERQEVVMVVDEIEARGLLEGVRDVERLPHLGIERLVLGERARADPIQPRARETVRGREQRYVEPPLDQPLGEKGHDALPRPVVPRRHAPGDRREHTDAHALAARAGGGALLGPLTVDSATPAASRRPARLDEFLEALQIALHAQVVSSKNVADALGRVLRLPMELELDLGLVAIVWFEPDDAFVRRARDAPPRDDTVGLLLIDRCVPFLDSAPHAPAPMQPLVVHLLDRLDAFHEARELLELCPLVVSDSDRANHLDRLLQIRNRSSRLSHFFHDLYLRLVFTL